MTLDEALTIAGTYMRVFRAADSSRVPASFVLAEFLVATFGGEPAAPCGFETPRLADDVFGVGGERMVQLSLTAGEPVLLLPSEARWFACAILRALDANKTKEG